MNPQFENNPARKGRSKKTSTFNPRVSMPSNVVVKAKLEMTEPGDADEREADEMADSIVNEGKVARAVSSGHSGGGVALPSHFDNQIASFQGHGSRLYGGLKEQMESGFGRDFSDVRLHTDDAAAEMSGSISAKAFTYGNDVFFNRGQFNPQTKDGQHLIAHELAHVSMQTDKVSRQEDQNMTPEIPMSVDRTTSIVDDIKKYTSPNRITPELPNSSTSVIASPSLGMRPFHLSFSRKLFSWLASNDPFDNLKAIEKISDYLTMVEEFETISNKTIDNAIKNRRREPVTVAIRMAVESDHNGAFIKPNYYGIRDHLIVLQEIEDIGVCTRLLHEIDEVIGPIQNLIISGHGEHNSIQLNDNHSFVTSISSSLGDVFPSQDKKEKHDEDFRQTSFFFEEISKLMPETDEFTRRIILDSCLTDSFVLGDYTKKNQNESGTDEEHFYYSKMSFAETFFSSLGWSNRDNFIAPQASLGKTTFNNANGALNVEDDNVFWYGKYYRNRFDGSYLLSSASGRQYYKGPGAKEIDGAIRGILKAYYLEHNVSVLINDLYYFKNHRVLPAAASQKDRQTFQEVTDMIDSIIDDAQHLLMMDQPLSYRISIPDLKFKVLAKLHRLAFSPKLSAFNSITNYVL